MMINTVNIELSAPKDEPLPYQWSGDAKVEWKGSSRILKIQETASSDHAHRAFTIEGGFPIGWYEDELTDAIRSRLDRQMLAIAELV